MEKMTAEVEEKAMKTNAGKPNKYSVALSRKLRWTQQMLHAAMLREKREARKNQKLMWEAHQIQSGQNNTQVQSGQGHIQSNAPVAMRVKNSALSPPVGCNCIESATCNMRALLVRGPTSASEPEGTRMWCRTKITDSCDKEWAWCIRSADVGSMEDLSLGELGGL